MAGVEEVGRFLEEHGVKGELLEFPGGVETVEAASRLSGVESRAILKTLILRGGGEWFAVILRGDTRLDLARLRRKLGVRGIRFARAGEIVERLGVGPGSVSPFMEGISSMRVIVDSRVVLLDGPIVVGGGSPRHLLKTTVDEIIRVWRPVILDVSH